MNRIFGVILLVLAQVLGLLAQAEEQLGTYKYWDLNASQKRSDYQYSLLKLVLDKTQASYGAYSLERNTEHFTSSRSVRELERGELINIISLPVPIWGKEDVKYKSSFTIPKPLLRGLLGYRCLVIRKIDLAKFMAIKTQDQLRALRAGQGRDWEDINVYRYNNYQVVDNADYVNLFAMLEAGRFDYIPLSIIEADEMLKKFDKYSNDFMIVPDLIVYYPFPVLYNVSINHPELVGRLEKGLSIVGEDGSMDELFRQYFADSLRILERRPLRVAVLKIPKQIQELGIDQPILLTSSSSGPIFLP